MVKVQYQTKRGAYWEGELPNGTCLSSCKRKDRHPWLLNEAKKMICGVQLQRFDPKPEFGIAPALEVLISIADKYIAGKIIKDELYTERDKIMSADALCSDDAALGKPPASASAPKKRMTAKASSSASPTQGKASKASASASAPKKGRAAKALASASAKVADPASSAPVSDSAAQGQADQVPASAPEPKKGRAAKAASSGSAAQSQAGKHPASASASKKGRAAKARASASATAGGEAEPASEAFAPATPPAKVRRTQAGQSIEFPPLAFGEWLDGECP
jgi:hypothetical protein